jgi:hypothetical protein
MIAPMPQPMPPELSTARFVALLALRGDLGKPEKVPDPLPKTTQIVISDWPARNAQLLLRLCRALTGRDEVFSVRDIDAMDLETLSVALALTMAGINGLYTRQQWLSAVAAMEKAVRALGRR